jgi:hypothetical protein
MKPAIFLDVDGVINMYSNKSVLDLQAELECDDIKEISSLRLKYRESLISKINSWADVADVYWLTSWDVRARDLLGPAVGLRAFEMGWAPGVVMVDVFDSSIYKKNSVFYHAQLNDRPIVWIDEQLRAECGMNEMNFNCKPAEHLMNRPNTLLVEPDDEIGLTPRDEHIIDAFLCDPSNTAVHPDCQFHIRNFDHFEVQIKRCWNYLRSKCSSYGR